MRGEQPGLPELAVKTIIVHTVTYFVMGILALSILEYGTLYAHAGLAGFMRPTTDPMVMAGPLFQPFRGLVFALAIYPLLGVFMERRHGWMLLWWLLVALGIISTFGPAPGSLEGLVYTRVSIPDQLIGLPEVLLQSLLLALGVVYWVSHPDKRWLTWLMAASFVVIILLSVAGLVVRARGA